MLPDLLELSADATTAGPDLARMAPAAAFGSARSATRGKVRWELPAAGPAGSPCLPACLEPRMLIIPWRRPAARGGGTSFRLEGALELAVEAVRPGQVPGHGRRRTLGVARRHALVDR